MNNFIVKRLAVMLSAAMVLTSTSTTAFAGQANTARSVVNEPVGDETTDDVAEAKAVDVTTEDESKDKEIVGAAGATEDEAISLDVDETYNIELAKGGKMFYTFTPEMTNYYYLQVRRGTKLEAEITIYKESVNGNVIASEYFDYYDFKDAKHKQSVGAALKAGEKYYVEVSAKADSNFPMSFLEAQVLEKGRKTTVSNDNIYAIIQTETKGVVVANASVECMEEGNMSVTAVTTSGIKETEDYYFDLDSMTSETKKYLDKTDDIIFVFQPEDINSITVNLDIYLPTNIELTDGKGGETVNLSGDAKRKFYKIIVDKSRLYDISFVGKYSGTLEYSIYNDANCNSDDRDWYDRYWYDGVNTYIGDKMFMSTEPLVLDDYEMSYGIAKEEKETTFLLVDIKSDDNASIALSAEELVADTSILPGQEVEEQIEGFESHSFKIKTGKDANEYVFRNNSDMELTVKFFNEDGMEEQENTLDKNTVVPICLDPKKEYIMVVYLGEIASCPEGGKLQFSIGAKTWKASLSKDKKTLTISGKGEMETNYFLFDTDKYYKVTKVVIGDEITAIGDGIFGGMQNVETVVLGKKVKRIGDDAFSSNSSLKKINLDSSALSVIGDYAFKYCGSLTKVKLGKKVKTVGEGAFEFCNCFNKITVDENNKYYVAKKNVLYSKDMKTLVVYPNGLTAKTFEIPEFVEVVSDRALAKNYYLKTVVVGKNVNKLGDKDYELKNLDNLSSIKVAEGNEKFKAVSGVLFSADGKTIICCPKNKSGFFNKTEGVTKIAYSAFEGSAVNDVLFPETLETIEDHAFYNCANIKTIVLNEGVKTIGKYSFSSSWALDTVQLPKTVETISDYAFAWVNEGNLISTYYTGTESEWNNINIKEGNDPILEGVKRFETSIPKGQEQEIEVRTAVTIEMGNSYDLNVSAYGKLKFEISNPKVLKVSKNGVVTPLKTGKCTITVSASATSIYNASEPVKIVATVVKGANGIYLTKNKKVIKKKSIPKNGKTIELKKYIFEASGKVTYKSSNKKYITVSSKGQVKIKKNIPKGEYCITVKAAGNKYFKAGTVKYWIWIE